MAESLLGVGYDGAGTYVRVGMNGIVQTSSDALNWTTQTSGVANHLYAVAYGNGVWVAVGDTGTVITSTDTITWTLQTAPTSEDINDVFYSGIFLCCGGNGYLATSVYGASWGTIASGTTNTLRSVTAAASFYTAVGDYTTIVTGYFFTTNLDVDHTEGFGLAEAPATGGSALGAAWSDDMDHWDRAFQEGTGAGTDDDIIFDRAIVDTMSVDSAAPTDGSTFNHAISETINQLDRIFESNELITEIMNMSDILSGVYSMLIAEQLTLDDTLLDDYVASPLVTENIEIADDAPSSVYFAVNVLSEDLTLSDVSTSTGVFNHVISENIVVRAYIKLDDEIYTGWVVNVENSAVSQYTRYNFHSFAKFNDTYYAANEGGIFELGGNYDDGFIIKSKLKTGIMDFNSQFQKRIPRAYVGIRKDGEVILKTITNEDTERWYSARGNYTSIHRARIPMGKGVKSAYWQFELINSDGEDFELENIALMPIILTRRPR